MVTSSSSSSYALGLFFILIVNIIWTGASVLTQYLYTDQSLDSPFLLTYICSSLFVLFLPTRLLVRRFCSNHDKHDYSTVPDHHHTTDNNEMVVSDVDGSCAQEQEQDQEQRREEGEGAGSDGIPPPLQPWSGMEHFRVALLIGPFWFVSNWTYNASLAYTSITSSTVLASTGCLFTFLFAVLFKDEAFTWMKFAGVLLGAAGSIVTGLADVTTTTPAADFDNATGSYNYDYGYDDAVLFSSNNNTASSSFSASSLLASSSGGHPHLQLLQDNNNDDDSSNIDDWWNGGGGKLLFGDLLGLVSAVGYGMYAVMFRVKCPHDESLYSMQLLFGYIGLCNTVLFGPVAVYELFWNHHDNNSGGLTWVLLGLVVVKGLFDNVLSDYLFARAVILINATVASVGLGLTIPLAFVADLFLEKRSDVVSVNSILGASAILVAFILVNAASSDTDTTTTTTTTTTDNDDDLPMDGFLDNNNSSSNNNNGQQQTTVVVEME